MPMSVRSLSILIASSAHVRIEIDACEKLDGLVTRQGGVSQGAQALPPAPV
jgi:hypothetical protein